MGRPLQATFLTCEVPQNEPSSKSPQSRKVPGRMNRAITEYFSVLIYGGFRFVGGQGKTLVARPTPASRTPSCGARNLAAHIELWLPSRKLESPISPSWSYLSQNFANQTFWHPSQRPVDKECFCSGRGVVMLAAGMVGLRQRKKTRVRAIPWRLEGQSWNPGGAQK